MKAAHASRVATRLTLTAYLHISRILLDKLIVVQPVKKFQAFYGTQRFITVFTGVHYSSLYSSR
jgi:hypothetical protein